MTQVTSEATTSLDFAVSGMTCGACVARVEKALNALEGVEASVNLPLEKAHVLLTRPVSSETLIAVIASAGYDATAITPDAPAPSPVEVEDRRDGAEAALRQRLLISAILSIPVVAMGMIPALQFDNWQWASLTLAAPVAVWGAWPFHVVAWRNLRHRAATMDTLVSLGVTAAFGWSLYALFFGHAGMVGMTHGFTWNLAATDGSDAIYLEAAAAVTTLILAGKYAEARTKRQAGAALRALLGLGAKEVAVLAADGTESLVPIGELAVGDRFVVRPGDKVATDGVVREGAATIDQSMLTGESVPIEASVGTRVVGGTLAHGGRLIVQATAVGAATQLSQMALLVERAQSGKAEVQRLADKISGLFVPVVLVLAAATFVAWGMGVGPFSFDGAGSWSGAASAAVAVLIVACPCALGLATPIGLLVGSGRGAQLGLLIRGPEVLEAAKRLDTVVLDKTGTITTGVMAFEQIQAARGIEPDDVLRRAAAVEAASEHPIAAAIVAEARRRFGDLPSVDGFAATPGVGVEGVVEGVAVTVGRSAASGDLTAVDVVWEGRWRGTITVSDQIKESSREGVAQLRALGLEPMLVSGDARSVALRVAAAVGIGEDHVIAEVLPEGKAEVIEGLQAQGRGVVMVGDGVNDAPALATADLGIAMGTGAEIAIAASDLTVVGGSLTSAATAIRLSRSTLRTIKGNLVWAFAYNVAAIPLAMMGLLQPMIAGAAMAASSVLVIGNSLQLRAFK